MEQKIIAVLSLNLLHPEYESALLSHGYDKIIYVPASNNVKNTLRMLKTNLINSVYFSESQYPKFRLAFIKNGIACLRSDFDSVNNKIIFH